MTDGRIDLELAHLFAVGLAAALGGVIGQIPLRIRPWLHAVLHDDVADLMPEFQLNQATGTDMLLHAADEMLQHARPCAPSDVKTRARNCHAHPEKEPPRSAQPTTGNQRNPIS